MSLASPGELTVTISHLSSKQVITTSATDIEVQATLRVEE
jgi:hypothetical protein